jgi:hypothetical protein
MKRSSSMNHPMWRFVLVAAALTLAACDNSVARKLLGMEKTVPDEFKVMSRAPLSLPPDYALRPPQPGAIRPQEQSIPQRALAAVTGTAPAAGRAGTSPAGSSGEAAFLAKVGSDRVNPDIRTVIDRESSAIAEADQTFLDKLVFWRPPEDRSPLVDPQRESQRLRENAALGRPASDGDTPSIRRRKRALLEGLF